MGPRISDKRERLVDAAKHLIHVQGYNQTTLSDIARESSVPLGNVYYYFKTKEDIAAAVIEERRNELCGMMSQCEKDEDPRQRIINMLDRMLSNADMLVEHGCPIGSLCHELGKNPSALSDQADGIIRKHIDWCTEQFAEMGRDDAYKLGVRAVADIQGACLAAHALGDNQVMVDQLDRLKDWVTEL